MMSSDRWTRHRKCGEGLSSGTWDTVDGQFFFGSLSIIERVLYIPGGAGFLLSTVLLRMLMEEFS